LGCGTIHSQGNRNRPQNRSAEKTAIGKKTDGKLLKGKPDAIWPVSLQPTLTAGKLPVNFARIELFAAAAPDFRELFQLN